MAETGSSGSRSTAVAGGGPTAHRNWLNLLPNPALAEHARVRAESAQNRIADKITVFAGSMTFVYIHIIWFGCWIGFGVEEYPYGLLTMIVSLDAIFLSTFVMISQNRADAKRQIVADQQWGNRAGRRQAEPRTARSLATDPRVDEAVARVRSTAVGRRAPSAFGVALLTQWTFRPHLIRAGVSVDPRHRLRLILDTAHLVSGGGPCWWSLSVMEQPASGSSSLAGPSSC
jgi:hypothetical protein